MKLVLRILFFLLLGALAIGLYYKNQIEFSLGERIIGFTVLGGAFIYLPLFYTTIGKENAFKIIP